MPAEALATTRLLLPIHTEDHVYGAESAAFTLVEYGDYECSACRRLFVIIRDLQSTLGRRLRIVYRHFPLGGIHPNAREAAEAAEAAGSQGRFWEMHNLLLQHQRALKRENLLAYAERLGLDAGRLRAELDARVYEDRVREDFRRGVRNGVYKPPGLFINGVRHDGPWGREILQRKLTHFLTVSA